MGEEVADEGEQVVPDPLHRSVVLGEQRRVHGGQGDPGPGADEIPGARSDLIEAEVDPRFRIEEDRLAREVAKQDAGAVPEDRVRARRGVAHSVLGRS